MEGMENKSQAISSSGRWRWPSWALVACLLLSVGGGLAHAPAAQAAPMQWNVVHDFRTYPNQSNPNPDSYGNTDVWRFLQSSSLTHDPATYSLLPNFMTNSFGVEGLPVSYTH